MSRYPSRYTPRDIPRDVLKYEVTNYLPLWELYQLSKVDPGAYHNLLSRIQQDPMGALRTAIDNDSIDLLNIVKYHHHFASGVILREILVKLPPRILNYLKVEATRPTPFAWLANLFATP